VSAFSNVDRGHETVAAILEKTLSPEMDEPERSPEKQGENNEE